MREYTPKHWRRTYGPALSGGLLDESIGFGSLALLIYFYVLSKLGIHRFIDLRVKKKADEKSIM